MMYEKKKKKTIILIVIGTIVLASLMVGGFLLGESSSKKEVSQVKTKQKNELVKQLQKLKNQLQNETNPTKKQELEEKKKNLEQQIQNLGDSNNSNNPPSNNPPTNTNKTHHQLTVRYNTEVSSKHEYVDINGNNKKRFLIDTKNKLFSSATASDLIIKDNQYNFSFNEEDATEKKGNNFIFAENNDNFQLTPTNTTPPPPLPNNNSNSDQIDVEIKFNGSAIGDTNYWGFINSNWPNPRRRFSIAKNHPLFKGKKMVQRITPNFKLSFAKKDASNTKKIQGGEDEYFFTENNQNFTLTPLGNWPDDPNSNGPNPGPTTPPPGGPGSPPPPQSPPPQPQSKITWTLEYTGAVGGTDYFFKIKSAGGLDELVIIRQNNPALNGLFLIIGTRYKFSFWTEDPANQFVKKTFSENETIELVEV